VSIGRHLEALLEGRFSFGLSGFSEEIVWHVPGSGELGGEHRGREAVLALVGRLLAPGVGRERIAYLPLTAYGDYACEWLELGPSGWPVVSRSENGRIREVWWCSASAW
jgi:hypothetical protein